MSPLYRLCLGLRCGLALALVVAAPAALASDAAELPEPIREALDAHDVAADEVSILVRARDGGRTHLRHNADTPRNPASVMKLATTFAALAELGPGHTWHTRAYADGPVRDGTLEGDLWLVGGGDPYLTAEDFWHLLGAIRRRGIERIAGDLVLDTSRFAALAEEASGFDGHPLRAYNQPPHPLLINFNAIAFELDESLEHDGVAVAMHPPLANVDLASDVRLDPDAYCGAHRWHVDYSLERAERGGEARLQGRLGTGCERARLYRTGLPVEDYVHGLFTSLWGHWGGTFDGGWRVAEWSDDDAEPLVEHDSRRLATVVRGINKHSNNVMTRQLALEIALARGADAPTEADGRAAVRRVLAAEGVDLDGLELDEVAGLSRVNRVTATFLADLLDAASDSLVMPEFLASLPVSGVDGTLEERLEDGPVQGRARMKTGRIRDVAGIAGYLRNAAGEDVVVAILINGDGVQGSRGEAVQDAIIRWAHDAT